MKKTLKTLLVISLVFGLSACKLSSLTLGVTTYPVEYIIGRIAQDRVNVVNLTANKIITRAQVVEDYQDQLENIDVVFEFGKLEPYLSVLGSEFLDQGVQMVDLTASASVYLFQRYHTTDLQGTTVTLESPYYEGSNFENIDVYQTDPYLWLDPITMISMAGSVKDWLVQYYPEEKQFFEDNYEELTLELAKMDADYQELWKQEIGFVSVTPSFGNWQKAFGIEVYPLILSRYGVLPTQKQLEFIKESIKAAGIQYIVHEPNLTEDMEALFQQVKTDLSLTSVEMHSLAFLTDSDLNSNKNYMTLMWENLDTLESMVPIAIVETTTTTP